MLLLLLPFFPTLALPQTVDEEGQLLPRLDLPPPPPVPLVRCSLSLTLGLARLGDGERGWSAEPTAPAPRETVGAVVMSQRDLDRADDRRRIVRTRRDMEYGG